MSFKHTLLALLDHAPGHGYQLHGLIAEALGEHWTVNTGQIYSTLSRLEREGLVDRRQEVADGDEDRTVYELTEPGRMQLVGWFRQPVSREDRLRDAFYAKLVLSRVSGSVSSAEVLQTQRKQLLTELHELTKLRRRSDAKSELPWLLLLESGIMHLEADLRWLDLCEERLDELNRMPPLRYIQRPRVRPPKSVYSSQRTSGG